MKKCLLPIALFVVASVFSQRALASMASGHACSQELPELCSDPLLTGSASSLDTEQIPVCEELTLSESSGERSGERSGESSVQPDFLWKQKADYFADHPWTVGERPAFAAAPAAPEDAVSELQFVKGALALGLLASYYRAAGQVKGDSVLSKSPALTNVALALCFSMWLTDNLMGNVLLGYDRTAIRNRSLMEDFKDVTSTTYYTVGVGVAYFKPCFSSFGLMTGADLSFGTGSRVQKTSYPGLEIKTKENLWRLYATGYLGVWYAINRYLVTAQLGFIQYGLTNSEVLQGEFSEENIRDINSEFSLALDTKAFLLGLRYRLNRWSEE